MGKGYEGKDTRLTCHVCLEAHCAQHTTNLLRVNISLCKGHEEPDYHMRPSKGSQERDTGRNNIQTQVARWRQTRSCSNSCFCDLLVFPCNPDHGPDPGYTFSKPLSSHTNLLTSKTPYCISASVWIWHAIQSKNDLQPCQ